MHIVCSKWAAGFPSRVRMVHRSSSRQLSRFPIVTIWAMNAGDLPLGPVDETQAEDALVLDNSHLTIPEQNAYLLGAAHATINAQSSIHNS